MSQNSPQTPHAGTSPLRVVVVGAGIAGLAAAWKLRTQGCEVRVLEASASAGGSCLAQRIDGFSVERALHVISSSDAALVAWMRSVGAGDEMLPLRPVLQAQATHGVVRSIDESSIRGISRIAGVRNLDALRLIRLPRLMKRYARALDPLAPEAAEEWDYRSVADFVRLYFGQSAYRAWAQPCIESQMLGDGEQLSRVAFMLAWQRAQAGRAAVARHGLSPLVIGAADRLGVETGAAVTGVASRAEGRFSLQIAGGQDIEADAVVLATPAARSLELARELVTPAERDVLGALRVEPRITLSVAMERPLSGVSQFVRVPAGEKLALAALLVEPGGADARAPQGCGLVTAAASLAFARAARDTGDEVVQKELRSDFERLYPRAPVRFSRIERSPDGTPSFEVGTYRLLARLERIQQDRRALGRRLYFAGDWRAGVGAARAFESGLRAAEALAADFR